MKKHIIIVAGGKGLRMGHDLPKQFITVCGKPVLMRTIQAFYDFDSDMDIILVLSPDYGEYWSKLCEEYTFVVPHRITFGGETRYHSVKNGLALVQGGVVGIHDAARPFVSTDLIERCYANIERYTAVVPAIDVTDSLREMLDNKRSKIIDRSKIKQVQTPQVFLTEILKKAYQTDFSSTFTDDASVVEAMGIEVHLVQGETTNIKITTPFDLEIAKLLVKDDK